MLDGAQPRPRRGRPGRGPPRRVGGREELLRERPAELPRLRWALHLGRGEGLLSRRLAPADARRVGGARDPPPDRDRRREAEGTEGPRPAVRRDGRRRLHRAARGHGLPRRLRPPGPLGGLLDGHRERPRASGVGQPRPILVPGAPALPESGLRLALPEGERLLGEMHPRDLRRPGSRGSFQGRQYVFVWSDEPCRDRAFVEAFRDGQVGAAPDTTGAPRREYPLHRLRGHLAAPRKLRRPRGRRRRSSTGWLATACASPACSRARASARRAGRR